MPGGGGSNVKRTGELIVPFRGQKRVLVPLRVEKKFKPRPQNRILAPLRGPFKISDEHPRPFPIEAPSGRGGEGANVLFC